MSTSDLALGSSRRPALLKSIGVIASGTVAAQAINFVGYAVSARFLSPVDFGIFAAEIAVSTPLSLIATGRYEAAFMRANSAYRVVNLFFFTCLLFPIVALTTSSILYTLAFSIPILASIDVFGIFLLMFLQSLLNTSTQLTNYNGRYRLIAASRVLGAAATQFLTITLASFRFGSNSLSLGFSFGLLLSSIIYIFGNFSWISQHLRCVSLKDMTRVARHYLGLSLFNAPQTLAAAFQDSAAIAFVTVYFGSAGAGLYSLNGRLLRAPINIVAESVGRVLQRHFATIGGNMPADVGETRRQLQFLRESVCIVIGLGLLFTVAAWLFAPVIVARVFEARWSELGDVARAASPYYGAYLAASALAAIPVAAGARYRLLAFLGAGGSALYVLIFATASPVSRGLPDVFWITSGVMIPYFLIFIFFVYSLVARRIGR